MQDNLSPSAMPFDVYEARYAKNDNARNVCHSLAMAKRMLMQEKVRDFSAADVVALAALIEARELAGK